MTSPTAVSCRGWTSWVRWPPPPLRPMRPRSPADCQGRPPRRCLMPVEIGAPAPITNHVFGDIDAVRNAGRQLSLAGDHLDQFQQGLDGAGSGVRGQWTGDAARAFSDSTRLAVDDLRTISLACREASDILFTLANELTNALGTAEHMRRVAEADNLIVSPDFTGAGELMTTEKCFNQRTAILAEATFEQARQHARDAHK